MVIDGCRYRCFEHSSAPSGCISFNHATLSPGIYEQFRVLLVQYVLQQLLDSWILLESILKQQNNPTG